MVGCASYGRPGSASAASFSAAKIEWMQVEGKLKQALNIAGVASGALGGVGGGVAASATWHLHHLTNRTIVKSGKTLRIWFRKRSEQSA